MKLRDVESSFHDFESWISSYQKQYKQIFIDNFYSYEGSFEILSAAYNAILDEKDLTNESEAWDFSIFNFLSFLRPEENLHSPLLAELLDSNGSHGQKDLFYKLFLHEIAGEERTQMFINKNYKDYFIKKEQYIKNEGDTGFVDIVIKSTNRNNKFAVILENKWNSGDSCPDQLFKYYRNFINPNGLAFTDDNLIVIYLTKSGDDPRWVEDENFEDFLLKNKGVNYFPISYIYNIRSWLEKCLQLCKSEKVNYLIEQYLNFIKYDIRYRR